MSFLPEDTPSDFNESVMFEYIKNRNEQITRGLSDLEYCHKSVFQEHAVVDLTAIPTETAEAAISPLDDFGVLDRSHTPTTPGLAI